MALPSRSLAPSLSDSITATRIGTTAQEIKSEFHGIVEKIEAMPSDEKLTWPETFGLLSLALGTASECSAAVTLPSMTHADPDVRSSSTSAQNELKNLFDSTFSRPRLYNVLASASASGAIQERSESDKKFARQLLGAFQRNGCELPNTEGRDGLMAKRAKIEELCSAFSSALNENTEKLFFWDEELDGIDASQFPLVDGKRQVSLKAPDTMPVLQFVRNPSTRRKVSEALARKCQEENTPRFLETLRLRHECATLLGYPSHAHYMLETKMASTPEVAAEFLREMLEKIKPQRDKDLKCLHDLKSQEEGGDAGPIHSWDIQYYIRAHKASLGVDEAKLRTYFPLEHVKTEILSIYEELLHLRFERVKDATVWHPDVECYAVHDSSNGNEKDEALGYFFLDIFPRDGKYSHQCVYPLRPSYINSSGYRVRPACVNIGNLSRGREGAPSLLRFREVETFFHEFGHVMHCVLSESEHSLHAWAWSAVPWPGGVEQDFLEVPSMMLENFVWRPEILRRLSKHSEDGTPLPDDMVKDLSNSRFVMSGFTDARYLAMSLYDIIVHSNPGPKYVYEGSEYDAKELYATMMADISGVLGISDSFSVASWYHPMMGYDAGYYSYRWSEAYAADLFSEFEKSDRILDLNLGMKYRKHILAPCSMTDGNTMLVNFLGREPSTAPFFSRMAKNN